jgi:hypothetical protein
MFNTKPRLQARTLAFAAMTALLMQAPGHAAVVTQASGTVTATSTGQGAPSDNQSSPVTAPGTKVRASSFTTGGVPGTPFFAQFGRTIPSHLGTGTAYGGGLFDPFAANAGATSIASGSSEYSALFYIENDLAVAQQLSFTSILESGSLTGYRTLVDATGSGTASVAWQIAVDGMIASQYNASLNYSGSSYSHTNSNFTNARYAENLTGTSAELLWDRTSVVTDLGVLSPSQSVQIRITLQTSATSNFQSFPGTCIVPVLTPFGFRTQTLTCIQQGGSFDARLGDPADLSGTNASRNTLASADPQANAVPAPGTLVLLALGLVGVLSSVRRTKTH